MDYVDFVMDWLASHYSRKEMRYKFNFVNSTLEKINTAYMNAAPGDASIYAKIAMLIQQYETEKALESL